MVTRNSTLIARRRKLMEGLEGNYRKCCFCCPKIDREFSGYAHSCNRFSRILSTPKRLPCSKLDRVCRLELNCLRMHADSEKTLTERVKFDDEPPRDMLYPVAMYQMGRLRRLLIQLLISLSLSVPLWGSMENFVAENYMANEAFISLDLARVSNSKQTTLRT